MSTFVLVHGGGHGGWCYRKVKHRLEAADHEVFAPSLTGLAERSRSVSVEVGLEFHIDDVVQLMHYWDLRDVVLVGHSYGGMVITGVADRANDRVAKLVYLDADDIVWADERLTPHPWRCFEQKLVLHDEEAVWSLPQFHIVCESTIPARRREVMERARSEGRLYSIDTGHDLMITEPGFVADTLLEIAGR